MAWDGGGTFDRVHNFSADASAGIQAQAVRFDAEFDGIKTGLENCQTLTGETSPTANSPMGGFKHTGVAVATSTDNYLRADQASNQVGIYVRDVNTGVTGTMSASAALFPTAFTDGQRVTVKVSADGSATATRVIKINGLSANIVDNNGSAVPATRMLKDGIFDLIYDSSAAAFRAIALDADTVGIAANTSAIAALTSSGSFQVIWTGFTTPFTTSCNYSKSGNIVVAQFTATVQRSASTSAFLCTTSTIPANIIPAGTRVCVHTVQDNDVHKFGKLWVQADGAFRFYSSASNADFSLTGLRGYLNNNFTYFIDDPA